jgi:hypothetical protein
MSDVDGEGKPAAGAILSDDQIRRLKTAIIIMSALLVIGVVTLIARVVYLASGRSEQAATTVVANAGLSYQADIKLPLPPGASLKGTTLQGGRLLAHYTSASGDGVLIVDLATGKVVSHVRVETGR